MIYTILSWLVSLFGYKLVSIEHWVFEPLEQEEIIKKYIAKFARFEGDGEWKAHQVYAKLIKDFPDVPKSKLRLAIELVYNKYYG